MKMSQCSVCCAVAGGSGGADLMGLCVVGRQYGGLSRDHWFSMLDRPRKAVAQWYPLTDHVPLSCPSSMMTTVPTAIGGNASETSVHLPTAGNSVDY